MDRLRDKAHLIMLVAGSGIVLYSVDVGASLQAHEGRAQRKPGEYEGCPLAHPSPLHVVACAYSLREPTNTTI